VYACVYCPECRELMPIRGIGPNEIFEPFDPGARMCSKNHLRIYKSSDVEVRKFDGRIRILPLNR
jgi:hypothetical protein